jgi:hypothetical protein
MRHKEVYLLRPRSPFAGYAALRKHHYIGLTPSVISALRGKQDSPVLFLLRR